MTKPVGAPKPEKLKKPFCWKRMLIKDAQILAVFYVMLSPIVAMPLYNKIIFFPFDEKVDLSGAFKQIQHDTGAARQDLMIPTQDGQQLNAWFFKVPKASKVCIVSHGNGGNIKNRLILAYMLLRAGTSVLLYDYEGYGKSSGSPSVPVIKKDGLVTFDYAVNKLGYKPENVIVYGESLGSGVAGYVAENRNVGAVILQSGFSSLSSASRSRLPWMWLYPSFAFGNNDMDNLSYVQGKHAPLLLVHGDKDEVLSVSNSDTMFAAATQPKTYVRIPGASHNDACTLNAALFATSIKSFLQTLP